MFLCLFRQPSAAERPPRQNCLLIWVDVFCHSAPEWWTVSNRVVIFITLGIRAILFFAIQAN
jgi:hypothetical protein